MTQRKIVGVFGLGISVLAAGLIGMASPASAAGGTHPMQIGQVFLKDHNADHWRDLRREQEIHREQEIRRAREQEIHRAEWRQDHQQDFRDLHRDWHNDTRDWHQDNHNWRSSNY